MEKNIKVLVEEFDEGLIEIEYSLFKFSGGEISVNIDIPPCSHKVVLSAFLKNSDDIMALLLLTDAIKRQGNSYISLELYYCPYARQDRVCNYGESFSLKVFASLINAQEYVEVIMYDPHSDVAPALINNSVVVSVDEIIDEVGFDLIRDIDFLVSPDAGANKKVFKVGQLLEIPAIRADKIRDLKTGQITDTEVYCGDLTGKKVLIIDDIIDGGRTFVELAKKLKEKGAEVELFATYGIFSKGRQVLLDSGISKITTFKEF